MSRRTKARANPNTAIAYIRVSTDEQTLGPAAQRAAIARWAESNHISIVAEHLDEGVSGGAEISERPGLMAALAALESHRAGVLVVAKRDRLARDVVVAAACERLAQSKGARIVAADGTSNAQGPEGELMRGLVDLFAQYERALIRTRTSQALAVKKARGERVGALPLGYELAQDGRALRQSESEQAAVARIQALRAAGLTVRGIADSLNKEGVPARGARWHPTSVQRVLNRAA